MRTSTKKWSWTIKPRRDSDPIVLSSFYIQNPPESNMLGNKSCFLSLKICVTTAIIFKVSLIKSVDKGEPWVRMYIKMSKVFDSVKNYVFLAKFKNLEVKNGLLNG